MDERKSIDNSPKHDLATKHEKRDWMTKLEAVSGKKIVVPGFMGTVYLLLDCSGSMGYDSKLEQAKSGAIGYAKDAQDKGFSVGIIQFPTQAELVLTAQDG